MKIDTVEDYRRALGEIQHLTEFAEDTPEGRRRMELQAAAESFAQRLDEPQTRPGRPPASERP